MYANIFAFNKAELNEIKPEHAQATAYARSQGIPASRSQVTYYNYDLGTQEPVRPGEKRQMLPSRNSVTDLGAFSGYLEELLDQPIQLEGQSPSTVEGYLNRPPAKEDIFKRNLRSLTSDELARLSPTICSRIITE